MFFSKIKLSILLLLIITTFVIKPMPAKAVVPVLPVSDPTALGISLGKTFEENLKYLLNKMGTIFFQNIVRKYLNDFARDAAIYITSAKNGQQALYIKEKYNNYLSKAGDAALGDFVESFANSVIADSAYKDKATQGARDCETVYNSCVASTTDGPSGPNFQACVTSKDKCLQGFMVKGGSTDNLKIKCDGDYNNCQSDCGDGSGTKTTASNDCLKSCESIWQGCTSGIGSSLALADRQRKAPMLGNGSPLGSLNVCNPSFEVNVRIGLGLTKYFTGNANYGSGLNECKFSDMQKNWTTAYDRLKDMSSSDFLSNFATWFNPTGSDLGTAFLYNIKLMDYSVLKSKEASVDATANQGWIQKRNFAGELVGVPNQTQETKQLAEQALWKNIDKVTGDIFVDAANVFLNQLAISGWQNLMQTLTEKSDSGTDLYSLYSTHATEREAVKSAINKLTEPDFTEPKVMNIIPQLASCPRENGNNNALPAGPTNCVISPSFAQALDSQLTVIEAVRKGLLPGNAPFGFNKYGEDVINYKEGYPYRSLLILRKYRIIPVGWELAAQEIQREYLNALGTPSSIPTLPLFNGNARPAGVTLNDLLACYDPNDGITGYGDGMDGKDSMWCRGLVDPYWVLKVPEYYCKAQGYGPELTAEPNSINNGVSYCSITNGRDKALIDGFVKQCSIDTDCCDKVETDKRNSASGSLKECMAKCTYKEKKLIVNRDANYCGDEQGCIGYDKNGRCAFWGYCTEEKRKWTFSRTGQDKICSPKFNTCTSFRDSKNQLKSYLANTLDFGRCGDYNVGCRKYLLGGSYDIANNSFFWNDTASALYLNQKADNCSASEEGCHEFIRIASGLGTNLIADGDFEYNDVAHWQSFGEITDAKNGTVFDGTYSLHNYGIKGIVYNNANKIVLPENFSFEGNQTYTLSAYVYIVKGSVEMGLGGVANADTFQKVSSSDINTWQNFVLTIDNTLDVSADSFYIKGLTAGTEFYIDDIKFATGNSSKYTTYRSNNLIYEKILPAYLENVCYVNPPVDYSLRSDAVLLCSKFARKCNKDEVGCELFTDVITKDQIAAKVKGVNACPSSCVGYDTYVQKGNDFYSAREDHFIPKTAKECRSEVVGCAAFTNLDKITAGGESVEYFSKFRNCVKQDAEQCGEYYTWEGSADTGYQVHVYQLKANLATANVLGGLKQPLTAGDFNVSDNIDAGLCDQNIYALPASDPRYNSDCMQFTGKDGKISYHLYSKTISCSDSCTSYRMKDLNINYALNDSVSCAAAGGNWDAVSLSCAVCNGAGVYDAQNKACVYQVLEKESLKCGASDAGCSEYAGNFSNRVKVILNDTFENSSLNGWDYGATQGNNKITSESLNQGGHSIATTNNFISKNIASQLQANKKYELSFIAKTNKAGDIIASIYMSANSTNNVDFANNIALATSWQNYKFTINSLESSNLDSLTFNFGQTGGNKIFIDNIKLSEIDDKYFLVRGSWETPDSCNRDLRGNPLALYAIGCRQYKDGSGNSRYLRSFDSLCQYSAVGCEALIDTNNNNDYRKTIYNDKDIAKVEVPADKIIYAVYDKTKECFAQKKGCQRFGLQSLDDNTSADVYKINDAERYAAILCKNDDVGCSAWVMENGGQVYFKDPGNRVCEYRQVGNTGAYAWQKRKNSYCFSKQTCGADADCLSGQCRLLDGDTTGTGYCTGIYPCTGTCTNNETCALASGSKNPDKDKCINNTTDAFYTKTIGLGIESEKAQPEGDFLKADGTRGYAGACSAADNGCTEYIDPEAKINPTIIAIENEDIKNIKRNVLYSLNSADDGKKNIQLSCTGKGQMYRLNNNNILEPVTSVSVLAGLSEEFIINSNGQTITDKDVLSCRIIGSGYIKEAIVGYRLKSSLSEEKPVAVDFIKGAVLFNERSVVGGKLKSLNYHTRETKPDGSFKGVQATPIDPPGNNTNVLLQVEADRDCATWLGCKSYGLNGADTANNTKNSVCLSRGLCDLLNEAGECIHFVEQGTKPENQTFDLKNQNYWINFIANRTGYSKVGYWENVQKADLYDLNAMQETGDPKVAFDGTFEGKANTGFNLLKNQPKEQIRYAGVISDAAVIQNELGISAYRYTPDGETIGKSSGCVEKIVDGVAGSEYVASAYVYLRYGSTATLKVGTFEDNGACPIEPKVFGNERCDNTDDRGYAIVAETPKIGKWVRITGKFRLNKTYVNANRTKEKLKVSLCATSGLMYFDDIRLEPALEVAKNTYIHSSCRLYPEKDSLSCDYYSDSGLRKKGWAGYCLEYDPRNPSACLLWYPVDKVASEEYEEGAGLDIPDDLYYCLQAEDRCGDENKIEPEMYCRTFLKVDKTKYWYSRINPSGTSYILPSRLLRPSDGKLYLDFGIDTANKAGGTTTIAITQGIASGYYGAFPTSESLGNKPITMGLSGNTSDKRIFPYVPYGGYNYGGTMPNGQINASTNADVAKIVAAKRKRGMCMATKALFDGKLKDNPYVLGNNTNIDGVAGDATDEDAFVGPYDGCFVRGIGLEDTTWGGGADLRGLETATNPEKPADRFCGWDGEKCAAENATEDKYTGGRDVRLEFCAQIDDTTSLANNNYPCGTISCYEDTKCRFDMFGKKCTTWLDYLAFASAIFYPNPFFAYGVTSYLNGTKDSLTYSCTDDGGHKANADSNTGFRSYKDYYLYVHNTDDVAYKSKKEVGYNLTYNNKFIRPKNGFGVRCNAWRNYNINDGQNIQLRTTDESEDDQNVACMFDCYNFINKFSMAEGNTAADSSVSMSRASKAVNRLFFRTKSADSCYWWNDTKENPLDWTYEPCQEDFVAQNSEAFTLKVPGGTNIDPVKVCANNTRPKVDSNNVNTLENDMCVVKPVISNINLNLPLENNTYEIKNVDSAWVDIKFNSIVDQDQLPLKKYRIDIYGKDCKVISRTANMFERKDKNNPHLVRYFFDKKEAEACGGMVNGCVTSTIRIEDNWGAWAEDSTSIKVCWK